VKKKGKKILSVCSIASLLIASSAVSTAVEAVDSSSIIRIGGTDRYETAAKIAEAGWSSSNYAIVANGEGYADALCAVPLAKANDAPILLTTSSDSLNQNTLNELKSLKVNHVIVVGGTGVVSDSVVDSIKTQVKSDVERLGGQDRYETSVKIAEKLGSTSKIVVASGEGYADALSAASAAAIEEMPILLTRSTILPDVTSNYITSNSQITKTYVIGGTASVSDSVANSLKSVERFGGADRYETNADVIEGFASDFKFNNIYAALGNGPIGNEFADALTGGALAAKNKNPLVITGQTLSSSTKQLLKGKVYKSATITVIGGTANISDTLAQEMKDAFGASSSGGGGGGGGSSSSYTNITSNLKSGKGILGAKYTSYKEKINNNSKYNKYFKIDSNASDDSNYINVDLQSKGQDINNLSDVFKKAQSRYSIDENGNITDTAKFNADIDKINDKLSAGFNNVTINGDPITTFLGSLGSQYFDSNGNLVADKIQAVIESHSDDMEDAYEQFKTDVNNQIDKYFTDNAQGQALANKDPELTYDEDIQINRIVKGNSSEVFDASQGYKLAVEELVNKLVFPSYESDDFYIDTYKVYLTGGDYINIKVNPFSE